MAWWHPAAGSAALATGLVLWQVQRRDWSESHTWRSAVQQYMLYTPMWLGGGVARIFYIMVEGTLPFLEHNLFCGPYSP